MKFSEFLKILSKIKNNKLIGVDGQFKLAPKNRKKNHFSNYKILKPKKAGVLILFFPNKTKETTLLLTKRATYNGKHSSQISFPGGKKEKNDVTIVETALREAKEEVGIDIGHVKVIRKATDNYIPPSNFLVTPILAYTEKTPKFQINYEVDLLIKISIEELLDNSNQTTTEITISPTNNLEVPCYKFKDQIVWGATAMILSEIKELIKQSIDK